MKKATFIITFMLLGAIGSMNAQDAFLAEVRMFAGNFAPRGWAKCEGQLLPISQNTALFSLLGTIYGGDGRSTFALPDLRGRVPVGVGNGSGLPTVSQGARFGNATTTLNSTNLPQHTHQAYGVTEVGSSSDPSGNLPANTKVFDNEYGTGTLTPMNAGMIDNTGSSQSFENRPPSLGMNYIICISGIYPSRT
ncbi:MAG: microcystin-dependent protein [Nonlabens sp.]|jgi:microcystin-dependent protein|uniref:phage tail protein n=1 Tax=Nonlabens sp. TaxID=1888209 RepID=UPI0039E67CE4